jgi:hypothetical protein
MGIWRMNRKLFNEEIKFKLFHKILKSREILIPSNFFNLFINTPEFSRFVLGIPIGFLTGVTLLSLAPPTTLPLVYEKVIPYQLKTIAITSSFMTFVDLSQNNLCQIFPNSNHRVPTILHFVSSLSTLLLTATVLTVSDHDPHRGYPLTLGLLALQIPSALVSQPVWVRAWRLGFIGVSAVSIFTAWRKLKFLEENWDKLVFSLEFD